MCSLNIVTQKIGAVFPSNGKYTECILYRLLNLHDQEMKAMYHSLKNVRKI